MTSRRADGAFRILAVLFAATVIGVHAVRIVEPLGVDQGLFACFARWVPRGWLPYRDLFDSKPPLFLYSYALAAAIPGDLVRGIWWFELAWLVATLAVAYALGARVWDRWAGLASSALLFAGLWSPAWGGFWSRAQAEELLALPMLGAAWMAWTSIDRDAPKRALWAGVLTGVCGLYKIPSMAIAGAFAVAWLGCAPRRDALLRIARLAGGIALPWGAMFAWFAAHGATRAFVDGVFVYHRYNAAFIAPPWTNVLQEFSSTMFFESSLTLAAGAIGAALLVRSRAREAWWIAPWVVLTMTAIVLQRQLAPYHYLLAAPALALAGGYGVRALAKGSKSPDAVARALAIAGVALLAVLFLRSAASWWRAYEPDATYLAGRSTRDEYLRRMQRGNYSNVFEEHAAAYVRERTEPGDGILVWGLSPGIYAIADRHPVTRFPFHKILMTEAPLSRMWPGLEGRRSELMDRVRRDPPVYILIGRADANGFEPETSSSSLMRFRALADFVKEGYVVETEIGRFVVYRRSASAPSTSPSSTPR